MNQKIKNSHLTFVIWQILLLKTHMKKSSLDPSVIYENAKGPRHWKVWDPLAWVCSAVTFTGGSYLITILQAESNPPPTLPGSPSLFFCPFPLRHSAPLTCPHGFTVHLHSMGSECSKAGFSLLCTLGSWHTLGTHDLLVKRTNTGTNQNWEPGMNR